MTPTAHLDLAQSGLDSGHVRSCPPASVLDRRCRAVSLRRPWANLIVSGHQPVASHRWSTAFRGMLVIHGGCEWDLAGSARADEIGVPTALTEANCPDGYIGSVQLFDIHAANRCCAPWGHNAAHVFHWVFEQPRVFTTPVPGRGRRGIFWAGGPAEWPPT